MLSFVVPSRAFSSFGRADASAEDLSPFSKGTESGGTTEGCLNLSLETKAGSAVCDSGWEHPVYPAMLPPFCFVPCQEKLLKPVWLAEQQQSKTKQNRGCARCWSSHGTKRGAKGTGQNHWEGLGGCSGVQPLPENRSAGTLSLLFALSCLFCC